jgi:hypothetical protein
MRNLRTAVLVAVAAALAGCGDGGGSETITDLEPAPAAITFEKSGGIANTFQRLEVSPGGDATLIVGGDPAVSFAVPEPRLAALRGAAAAANLEDVGPITDTGCADCFVYSVSYGDAKGTRDQSDMPDAFADLVAELLEIARAHGGT